MFYFKSLIIDNLRAVNVDCLVIVVTWHSTMMSRIMFFCNWTLHPLANRIVVVVVVEMNIIKVALSHFCCRTTVQSNSVSVSSHACLLSILPKDRFCDVPPVL